MDARRTRACQKCKVIVSLDKLRLFPKNAEETILVCEKCCDYLKNTMVAKKPVGDSRISPLPPADYSTYVCNRCDYTFRVDRSKAGVTYNVHCPYCGKSDNLKKR